MNRHDGPALLLVVVLVTLIVAGAIGHEVWHVFASLTDALASAEPTA